MRKAPENHYFSFPEKQVVLVWKFPSFLTKKTIILAASLGLFFTLLLAFESNNVPKAALIGLTVSAVILIYSALKQQVFNSNKLRLALTIDEKELGTQSFFSAYTIPWANVKKIQFNKISATTLPVSHFDFWIYPKNMPQRFISIPKLNTNEYESFFEILQWHTQRNNVELVLV